MDNEESTKDSEQNVLTNQSEKLIAAKISKVGINKILMSFFEAINRLILGETVLIGNFSLVFLKR